MEDIQKVGVLHGDETGWRVNGKTHWLWCFTSPMATIFTIERSRAGPVVLEFIKECFNGVFVSDFWYAYSVLSCAKQKCLVHLLRDLQRVWKCKDSGGDWPKFCKKLKSSKAQKLKRHRHELFTFLGNRDVPFDNNFGERSIRGAVIMRKNSYNNRSERGAKTQSILMSVFFTLKQRGLNPVATVKKALRIYIKTGKLPKLTEFPAALG